MKKAFFAFLLLSALLTGMIVWMRSITNVDNGYVPRVGVPMWNAGGPPVVIDDAHWNGATATRVYHPFARLLLVDGYAVIDSGNVASPGILANAKVIVIANALGFRGFLRQTAQFVNVNLDALASDAFTDAEVGRIESWVSEGGSLLLVAEHSPAGRAAQSLAERFGVTMRDRLVVDPEHADRGETANIVFTRASRTLGSHQIIGPGGKHESIDRIVTFGGQALEGPPHAIKLLMFSGTAYEIARKDQGPEDRIPVPGLAQVLAMYHGRGKVIVVGDAELLTSEIRSPTGIAERIGLQWPGSDNEMLVRRMVGWLSGAVE